MANMTKNLIFLVEEQSCKELIDILMHAITQESSNIKFASHAFQGINDLKKNLQKYLLKSKLPSQVQYPDSTFIIIIDQDDKDCKKLKKEWSKLINGIPGNHVVSYKDNRSKYNSTPVVLRMACHELESFYLGELAAVEKGLGITTGKLAKKQNKNPYRDPDSKVIHAKEELYNLTNKTYKPCLGTKKIAQYLTIDLTTNKSKSFITLLKTLSHLSQPKKG